MFGSSRVKYTAAAAISTILLNKAFAQNNLDHDIITTFYQILDTWNDKQKKSSAIIEETQYTEEQLSENLTGDTNQHALENIEQINDIWTEYCDALPTPEISVQAKKLTYLVIGEPQTLPENFTYKDIFKAVFLMAIPDLLLQKHLKITFKGRTDDLFGAITYQIQDGRYTLYTGEWKDRKKFEEFVINTEIAHGEASDFKVCEDFLLRQKTFDRYTIAEFSMMLFDKVLNFSQRFLPASSDKVLFNVCNMLRLDPEECIYYVHNIFGWWLATYYQEKKTRSFQEKTTSDSCSQITDATEDLAKAYRFMHEQRHFASARNMYAYEDISKHLFVPYDANNSPANIIARYTQCVLMKISLGIRPAFTSHEITLQEATYPLECEARTKFLSDDEWSHADARVILGLKEGETYQKFICRPYIFPDCAFDLPLTRDIEDKNILDYFLVSSIDCLRQVDKKRCRTILYDFIMTDLWNGFLNDARCTEDIKQRCNNINLTPYRDVLEIILDIFIDGPVQPLALTNFAPLLKAVAKSNSELLLVVSQALEAHAKTQPAVAITPQETYIILHVLEKIRALNSSSNTLRAIAIIVQFSHLSVLQRLALIGIIAQAAYPKTPVHKIKQRDFYHHIQHLASLLNETSALNIKAGIQTALGENVIQSIASILSEEKLSTLIYWYEDARSQHKPAPVLTTHIANLCSQEQFSTLRDHLAKFELLRETLTLFPKIICQKKTQTVINKIDQKESAAEILLALKRTAEKDKNNSRIHPDLKNFNQVIDAFFSTNTMSNSEKTMGTLLHSIQEILPKETTVATKETDALLTC